MATYKTNRTIPVKEATKQRVVERCKKEETFDQFINKLVDLYDKMGRPDSA
jgi:hypothetical protein